MSPMETPIPPELPDARRSLEGRVHLYPCHLRLPLTIANRGARAEARLPAARKAARAIAQGQEEAGGTDFLPSSARKHPCLRDRAVGPVANIGRFSRIMMQRCIEQRSSESG